MTKDESRASIFLLGVADDEHRQEADAWRIMAFSAGGPAAWSVALVPVGDDVLYVTYGTLTRAALTENAEFLRAMEEGSRREGSQFGFVAVDGVLWTADEQKSQVVLPGGDEARRIHRMVEARFRHGKNLFIHDINPAQPLAVALEPAPTRRP